MSEEKENDNLLESKEEEKPTKEEKKSSKSSGKKNKSQNNNNTSEQGESSGSGKQTNKETTGQPPQPPQQESIFWTKYFPWVVCATSFVVQFFVLGFYKSFGPVYVKLLQPEPEGYGGSPVATCKFIYLNLFKNNYWC